jgi:hypothetical protein
MPPTADPPATETYHGHRQEETDYTDYAKRAFAPATRMNEVMVGNIERIARFQYEVSGDLLQLALDQLNATVKAKDLPTCCRSSAKSRRSSPKRRRPAAGAAEMATESHAGPARWIEDATSRRAAKLPDRGSTAAVASRAIASRFPHRLCTALCTAQWLRYIRP